MLEQVRSKPWYVGTWTLAGVSAGIVLGFAIGEAPVVIAVALAIGTGLDSWFHKHEEAI
ncbi:MAG TPA: hypothetical protein VJZ27_16605 [Aggregatilineales bacterium]|nr:hypothetical protein [Aggregatilineales bacterium]